MSDGPSDDEFVELTTMTEAAAQGEGGEPAKPEGEEEAGEGDGEGEGEGDAEAGKEGGEGEGDGEGGDDEPLRDERGRYKGGAQGRINELTRLRHDAERRATAAEARLAQYEGTATRNGAKPGTAAPKPSPTDFEEYGDYVEALTDWKADQREAERRSDDVTRAHEDAANARNDVWSAKVAAVTATIPDYAEIAGKSDIPVRDHVAAAIMDADRGPELVYHLAKNPEVAERLNEMSPARAAIELGRIEASLEEPAAPPPPPPARKTTTAPAPITPVKSGSTTAKDPAKMNMEEYKAYREKQGIR